MRELTWLRAKRLEAGFSLSELARELGVDPSYLSNVESYRDKMARKRLARYCEAIGITEEEYWFAFRRKLKAKLKAEVMEVMADG